MHLKQTFHFRVSNFSTRPFYDHVKVKLSLKCIRYPGILIVQQSQRF